MPLVARHDDEEVCAAVLAPEDSEHADQESDAASVTETAPPTQKPFANLRDLLKKQ